MTSENSHYVVDPWSRFISYCSLVVAVGALVWTLFGFGTFSNWGESSTEKSLDAVAIDARYKKEAEERNKLDEEIRKQWKQQQADQLTAFTDAANNVLLEAQQLVGNLQTDSVANASYTPATGDNESSARHVDGREDNSHGDNDRNGQEEDVKLADDEVAPIPITPAEGSTDEDGEDKVVADRLLQPLLAYVRESLKPEDDANAVFLTVRNRGSSPAFLARVEFTPSQTDESIFEVDTVATATAVSDDEDILSIVFNEEDNLASAKGKHGVYTRKLGDEHVVPAASDMRIRLTVANSKHVGWGFRGTVKLMYNGLEPLTVEDAQLVFVAADGTVRR